MSSAQQQRGEHSWIIQGLSLDVEEDCASTVLGLRVWFANIGDAAVGPFVVEANSAQQTVADGLDAGATAGVWFPDYQYGDENIAIVDATSLVNESNETNNRRSEHVPVPTLPSTCTPTSGTPSARSSAPTLSRTYSPAQAIDTPIAYLPVIVRSDTPTPTPTSFAVPPELAEPADGALLPQPVPPAAWTFKWQVSCPCYYSIEINRPWPAVDGVRRHRRTEHICLHDHYLPAR